MNRYESLLLAALEDLAPEKLKRIRKRGDLAEFLELRATAAQEQKDRLVAGGMLDHEAEEVVQRDLLEVA